MFAPQALMRSPHTRHTERFMRHRHLADAVRFGAGFRKPAAAAPNHSRQTNNTRGQAYTCISIVCIHNNVSLASVSGTRLRTLHHYMGAVLQIVNAYTTSDKRNINRNITQNAVYSSFNHLSHRHYYPSLASSSTTPDPRDALLY